MTVVYVDVLFLINFSMDFLALRLAGAILHIPAKQGVLLGAAALGGGYAVLSALLRGNGVISAFLSLGVAFLLCYIAYAKVGKKAYFGVVALFFGISWLLGGMITAFYAMLSEIFAEREGALAFLLEGDGKLALFFGMALLSVILLGIGKRHLVFGRTAASVRLAVREAGRECELSAFVDSGNTLCDPLSGRPCIVVCPSVLAKVLPADLLAFSDGDRLDPQVLGADSRRRVRLIPSDSLGGHSLLVGYLPEGVSLLDDSGGQRPLDAVLAFSKEGNGDFCGCEALISPALLT